MRLKSAWILVLLTLLVGCASYNQHAKLAQPQSVMTVGVTTQKEILNLLGKPTEQIDDQGQAIWIYSDSLKVPFVLGLIPVIGDIADVTEVAHTNRELIIQFDHRQTVKKYKLRKIE